MPEFQKLDTFKAMTVVGVEMSGAPESVKKCVTLLKNAKSDTEKFAALFMVTKLIDHKKCSSDSKKLIFEAIGFPFLKRLLLSPDVPTDCPPQVYKSVAMSILSAFVSEKEIATHPQLVSNVSVLLDIVKQADGEDAEDEEDQDSLTVINEAFTCLRHVASYEPGSKALYELGAVAKMSEIYAKQSFQTDEALGVLVALVTRYGPSAWCDNLKAFNALINVLSLDFATDDTERKFRLCTILHSLLYNAPEELADHCLDESWPTNISKALTNVLTSRLGREQRDPALLLAAQMMNILGPEWTIHDEEKPRQFFLLLIQLASVEIRMQLEDRKMETILSNSEVIISCFSILETCVSFIVAESLELEQKEKQQVYTALKGAFSAVISALNIISKRKTDIATGERLLVYGMIRALAAWLAQETSAMRNAIYELLPFLLKVCNESFYAYRSKHVSENVRNVTAANGNEENNSGKVDLLRLFLPALCHLTVEDKARRIMLDNHQEEIFHECLMFHWSIVHYKKPPVPRAERKKFLENPQPQLPPELIEKMKDSRGAIISVCNILMNITVLEGKIVEENATFASVTKFIFNNLPELKSTQDNLVVHANMAVLGLLLLKQQTKRVKKDDFTICSYIQCTIRFLWDAFSVDESNDGTTLVVSMSYKRDWIELNELWFLGMQTLSSILLLVPWISDFAVESGWVQGILEMLRRVKVGSLPSNTRCAYEDFLCHLVQANKDVIKILKDNNALTICRNHRFMELGKKLFGD